MEQLPDFLTRILDQSPFVGLLCFFIWALHKRQAVLGWQWQEKADENKRLTDLLTESTKINTRAVMLAEQNSEEIRMLREMITGAVANSVKSQEAMARSLQQCNDAIGRLAPRTRAIEVDDRS